MEHQELVPENDPDTEHNNPETDVNQKICQQISHGVSQSQLRWDTDKFIEWYWYNHQRPVYLCDVFCVRETVTDRVRPPIRFNLPELAGSVGDFGTIIPLILAVALVSDVNAPVYPSFIRVWFIITGLYNRLPTPLEAMKAIAVIVIAGDIGSGEVAAAGNGIRC